MKPPTRALSLLAALALVGGSSACGNGEQRAVVLADASALPPAVRAAPPVVQEAYRFAIANPEVLNRIPCYCGCGRMGHTSNLACYVREFRADGVIEFDDHAFG